MGSSICLGTIQNIPDNFGNQRQNINAGLPMIHFRYRRNVAIPEVIRIINRTIAKLTNRPNVNCRLC